MNILIKYDLIIINNELRKVTSKWYDILTILFFLSALLFFLHWKLSHIHINTLFWLSIETGAIFGIVSGKMIKNRLNFHINDSFLAEYALCKRTRNEYIFILVFFITSILSFLFFVINYKYIYISILSYFSELFIDIVFFKYYKNIRNNKINTLFEKKATIMNFFNSKTYLLFSSIIFILFLSYAMIFSKNYIYSFIYIIQPILLFPCLAINKSLVDFMRIVGYSSIDTMKYYSKNLFIFSFVCILYSFVLISMYGSILMLIISLIFLNINLITVFIYRIYTKKIGDLFISLLFTITLFMLFFVPIILPLFILFVLWNLHCRERTKTWLIT